LPVVPESDLWLSLGGEAFLAGNRLALLEQIAATGSITRAGKAVGISYRTAWDAVDRLNADSDQPLVERNAGGRQGGGTRLTAHGLALLDMVRAFREEHDRFLDNLRKNIRDLDRFRLLARKMSLKVSARNQLWGKVESIRKDGLKARLTLRVGKSERVQAEITRAGLDALGLEPGDEAYGLIKANWIDLNDGADEIERADRAGGAGRIAASGSMWNCLKGKVEALDRGREEVEITFRTAGGIPLILSGKDGTLKWSLAPGRTAYARFKASDVILGVPS
jgi:molybdate transport system regulatory protein